MRERGAPFNANDARLTKLDVCCQRHVLAGDQSGKISASLTAIIF